MRKKEEKGITLIALIITIIVMLILLGVTVSVVLNGGLFSTAKKATTDTQIEADRETLQSAAWGAIGKDGIINESNIKLPDGWSVEDGIYTSPKGNTFIINKENGTVEEVIVRNSTELERYIFGENGAGRNVKEILLVEDVYGSPTTYHFIEPPSDIEYLSYATVKLSDGFNIYNLYIKYNGEVYKFQIIIDFETMICKTEPEGGIEKVTEPEENSKVGKYVQYDEKEWIVLYDDNTNGLQMISSETLWGIDIYNEPNVEEDKKEDLDGVEGISEFEKLAYRYNHIIETLNKECERLVIPKEGVIKSVRSVGSNPIDPNSEDKTLFTSEVLENWANGIADKKLYNYDYNYISDLDRMILLGTKISENNFIYCLASRMINETPSYYPNVVDFGVLTINGENMDCTAIIKVKENSTSQGGGLIPGFRPVIVLENGALDGLIGDGTQSNPYILK